MKEQTASYQTAESEGNSFFKSFIKSVVSGWKSWNRFWFSPADPSPLGFIRIGTGLMVLYVHLTYTMPFYALFGEKAWARLNTVNEYRREQPFYPPPSNGWRDEDESAFDREMNEEEAAYYKRWQVDPRRLVARGTPIFSIWFHVTDPTWMMIIHTGFLATMLLFTLGYCTRVTAVLTWLAALSYIQRAWSSLFGMDTIMNILLIYLMIGPSGATYSLDSWLKRRRRAREDGSAGRPHHILPESSVSANFTLRMMQIHFCIIYIASALSKLQGQSWWNGTAIWGVTANPEFNPMNHPLYVGILKILVENHFLWEVSMTSGILFTLFVELGFPFMVWNRRLRPMMIVGSVLLHVGIGLIMGLASFSLLMVTLVSSFIPGSVIRWAINGSIDWLRGIKPDTIEISSHSVEEDLLTLEVHRVT